MKLFLQKNAKFSSDGGSAPRPPKQPPHCEFLATRLNGMRNFSMEYKIRSMEEKWNKKKQNPVWNMKKSSFISFHSIPCPAPHILRLELSQNAI